MIKDLPETILRQRAHKVKNIDAYIREVIKNMIAVMLTEDGTGIAAPQIGIPYQIIIVRHDEKLYVVINPEIVKQSKETNFDIEGCLSIQNHVGNVERYNTVKIKGLDRTGEKFRITATGMLARIFQHEIDHLNGILIIDRAERMLPK